MTPNPLISAEELLDRLAAPEGAADLRVIDARFELSDPSYGKAVYSRGTVPGAVHLDLDEDMAGPVRRHGGRHPLPDMNEFVRKLGALGVGDRHQVVVFDDSGSMYAARAWWLLRYAGHEQVRFLDGGLAAYLSAGGSLSTDPPGHAATKFTLRLRPDMAVDAEFVSGALTQERVLLLDARAPERYRGEVEPLDPKAGHIPGAIDRYYLDNLQGGRLAEPAALHARLAPAAAAETVVAYCGSGVSAAHLILALELAGYPGAKLYAGSWSDWASRDLPVAVGDEEASAG